MKTKLSVLIAFLLVAQASMAQFHLGVKGGANITKINGVSFRDQFRYGYQLGGFAEIGFGKFGIQPEVMFNQYSTKVDSNFQHVYQNAFKSSDNIRLNYLSIPVLLSYKVLGNFMSLQAGPQFGIRINNNETTLQNGKDAFARGDFSMLAGVHFKVLKFRVDGRYVVGLNNLNDLTTQEKWKNQGFQVAVGFAL